MSHIKRKIKSGGKITDFRAVKAMTENIAADFM
jgi:hypothetical protein